jgi:putative hemin transport protein
MAAWDALIAGHTQQSPAPLAIRPAEPLKYADPPTARRWKTNGAP